MRGSSVASASFSLGARGFFSFALFFFSPFLFRSTLETSKTADLHFFGDPPLVFLLRFFFRKPRKMPRALSRQHLLFAQFMSKTRKQPSIPLVLTIVPCPILSSVFRRVTAVRVASERLRCRLPLVRLSAFSGVRRRLCFLSLLQLTLISFSENRRRRRRGVLSERPSCVCALLSLLRSASTPSFFFLPRFSSSLSRGSAPSSSSSSAFCRVTAQQGKIPCWHHAADVTAVGGLRDDGDRLFLLRSSSFFPVCVLLLLVRPCAREWGPPERKETGPKEK
ncbi:hypothetical protein BT93_J0936 [Corymbia citriodora subsp. variegata]|nr:hypothetical protein BT93_J0936 [Corymbia citriodora subsp. variegata]